MPGGQQAEAEGQIQPMMTYHQIPPPQPMNIRGNVAENWTFFDKSWKYYKKATKLDKEPAGVISATLYAVMGRETFEIAQNLPMTDREDEEVILKALKDHFEPKRNTIFERYLFNTATQNEGEKIDSYLARLRKLAATCEYGQLCDELVRDRLVIGITDNSVRRRLLREKNLTLDSAMDMIRAAESSTDQLKKIDGEVELPLHAVKKKARKKKINTEAKLNSKLKQEDSNQEDEQDTEDDSGNECSYCGRSHKPRDCPAYGKECTYCHKKNHFARVCRSRIQDDERAMSKKKSYKKKIHYLDDYSDDSDSSDYVFAIYAHQEDDTDDSQRRQKEGSRTSSLSKKSNIDNKWNSWRQRNRYSRKDYRNYEWKNKHWHRDTGKQFKRHYKESVTRNDISDLQKRLSSLEDMMKKMMYAQNDQENQAIDQLQPEEQQIEHTSTSPHSTGQERMNATSDGEDIISRSERKKRKKKRQRNRKKEMNSEKTKMIDSESDYDSIF